MSSVSFFIYLFFPFSHSSWQAVDILFIPSSCFFSQNNLLAQLTARIKTQGDAGSLSDVPGSQERILKIMTPWQW